MHVVLHLLLTGATQKRLAQVRNSKRKVLSAEQVVRC